MTQAVEKQEIETEIESSEDYYTKFYKNQHKLRPIIIDYLFRNISFLTHKENIKAVTLADYRKISESLEIPERIIHKFVSEFLLKLIYLKRFLKNNPTFLSSNAPEHIIRSYLHRLYRLAPIFDYKRAKENAKILKIKLDILSFWPQFMTQITVVIFITDLLDKSKPNKVIQSNLRTLCCCSAYAFHRTRNKIGLTTEYTRNLLK